MRRRLIALSRVAPCLVAVLLFAPFAVQVSGQTIGQQIVPSRVDDPPTFYMSSFCLAVKCVGATDYVVVKATDPDPLEAERQAYDKANAACPNGIEHSYQLPPRACALIAIPEEPGPTFGLQRAMPSSSTWMVKASLIYCDGSPGFKDVPFEGASRCEAIRNARSVLCCDLKDPSKAAYITYCVVRVPCQPTCVCPR